MENAQILFILTTTLKTYLLEISFGCHIPFSLSFSSINLFPVPRIFFEDSTASNFLHSMYFQCGKIVLKPFKLKVGNSTI